MLKQLLNFINEQKLFPAQKKILLAVSGGIDSMAMLHLFQQANFNIAIAHCNFQLRGIESDKDQQLVETIANKNATDIYTKSFETNRYAQQHGISIQMSARYLRRAWFEKLLESEKYDFIATAHHLNDSLETILFNLAKGTGISGLKGISSKNQKYVRPLMFASREMIEGYIKANDITWREDKSNSSIKYTRNLIRLNIVPVLKKINPNLEQTFSHSLEKIAASEHIYKNAIKAIKKDLIEQTKDGIKIETQKLKSIQDNKLVLFETIENYGFNYHQAKDIILSLDGQPGKTFHSQTHRLVIDRKFLFISIKNAVDTTEIFIDQNTKEVEAFNIQLILEKIENIDVNFSDNKQIAHFDYQKLKFPLTIRKWQHGDWFMPLGMNSKKKLSDFMIDEKIPLNLKEQLSLLVSDDNIVWVINHRIDNRYKVSNQTKMVYKICNNDQSF